MRRNRSGTPFKTRLRDERGLALITVLLVSLAFSVVSVSAVLLATNASLMTRYDERLSVLESIADAGLEEARSRLNGSVALYPDTGYGVLENGAPVTDALGAQIPNVRRSIYAGPTGVTSGQYGVFGSIVVVVEDIFGNRLVRRGEIVQESFAKYAYFTNTEGNNIWFGGGDQIFGPVHSNDQLKVHTTGATFWSTVETAADVFQPQYGTFSQGYTQFAAPIPMPTTADLVKLRQQALAGNMQFVGNTSGGSGEASTRLEFVALDLNGDGDSTDADEGFVRVYQHLTDPDWVSGELPPNASTVGLRNSENCGYYDGTGVFWSADALYDAGQNWVAALTSATARCYLGGSDSVWGGFVAGLDARGGRWLPWAGPVNPALTGRPDAGYLHPINRALNPTFKGVIFVDGKVAISGRVRGEVTVAATNDIVIVDDLVYATDPGAGTCGDMMGIFSGADVVVADNTLNTPARPTPIMNYQTYDETTGEFIHGTVLALGTFMVETYWAGPTTSESCQGTAWGRGCLYLTGGVIQETRGSVAMPSGTGYLKRYSYDQCAYSNPPPYFPTTGHFVRGRYYEVDPVNFDVAKYFQLLSVPFN